MPAPINPPVAPASRVDRAQDTRESVSRTETWVPPEHLPMPNPRPGLAFRYVRKSILGNDDLQNWSKRAGDGWVPVKASEYPELMLPSGSLKADMVEIGGLVLCSMSAERKASREAYFKRMTQAQAQGIDQQLMRDAKEDRRMPMFVERRESFGRGG